MSLERMILVVASLRICVFSRPYFHYAVGLTDMGS